MDQELKNELIEILRENPPFNRYVSRGDIPDDIDVEGPHREVDNHVFRAIMLVKATKTPLIVPILGDAGFGKTHYYWVLKKKGKITEQWDTVYVPSPPSGIRILLHFYTCIVDELGDWIFDEVSKKVAEKYAVLKSALPKIIDINATITRALQEHPGLYGDFIKVLLIYHMDKDRKNLAKKWLIGETLSDDELATLNVRSIIDEDDIALVSMKVLSEYAPRPIILFIDEMEGPFNSYGPNMERKFLEYVKRVYNECKNLMIVMSCLTDVWPRINSIIDPTVKSRFEKPVKLREFKKEDLETFIKRRMTIYWDAQNIMPPDGGIFPFSEKDIAEIYEKSGGNPRNAIKEIIYKLQEIIYGTSIPLKNTKKSDEIVIKLTPPTITDAIIFVMKNYGGKENIKVELINATGEISKNKIKVAAFLRVKKDKVEKSICVDVPGVKNWNKNGGIAAFYAAKRIKKLVENGFVEMGIIAVPKDTKGTKFNALIEELGKKILVLRFNESELKTLVERVQNKEFDEAMEKIGKNIFNVLFSRT